MPIQIVRNAGFSNEDLNALRTAAWEQVGDQDWKPILARSLGWVCAFDDHGLAGFVNIAWDGGVHAFLLDTTVHPRLQRQGVGRALVNEAASLAHEAGLEWLHVDYEDELDSFYLSCGFTHTLAGIINLTAGTDERPYK